VAIFGNTEPKRSAHVSAFGQILSKFPGPVPQISKFIQAIGGGEVETFSKTWDFVHPGTCGLSFSSGHLRNNSQTNSFLIEPERFPPLTFSAAVSSDQVGREYREEGKEAENFGDSKVVH